MFEAGVLPEVWPEARKRKQRSSKASGQPLGIAAEAEDTAEAIKELMPEKITYNITGERRKELVAAIANYTGEKAIYQNAPSFAYHIGTFAVDKNGTLTGPIDRSLIRWLKDEGFTTEE